MNAILPTRQTKQPERAGLSHYEILADGLIHAAAVFDIAPDERFVERVATLAWANGVQLVRQNVRQAAEVSRLLGESLEVGRSETLRLCEDLAPRVDLSEDPFAATRSYYQERHNARGLNVGDSAAAGPIRQLVGEATLGGLLSRGLAPALYGAFADRTNSFSYEQAFLVTRVWFWSHKSGLPIDHPFLEMAAAAYRDHPHKRDLICGAIAARLAKVLDQDIPWDLELWLEPAWKEGIMTAKFAPDEVAQVAGELDAAERSKNLQIFDVCIVATATPDGCVNLPAAFSRYLSRWNACGLSNEAARKDNVRAVAACGFDFGFTAGMVAEMPESLGGKRGDK
jgi:hypothetical protein